MSYELFYTSAVQGLRHGSHGYCTVAMTRGLPAALVERLEAMSVYHPEVPPRDGGGPGDTVVYGHHRMTVGRTEYHVLTGIRPAGLDYTGRYNTLAHHVVLTEDELPRGGPAWLLQQPRFIATAWDGRAVEFPDGPTPPAGDTPAGPCFHWQEAMGDAGWAGALAQAFLDDPNRPTYLLIEPGQDPLPLLVEAIGLLPAAERWDVTFSTYFTGGHSAERCSWRCVPSDSPQAAAVEKVPGVLVLRVNPDARSAPESTLAECARSGQRPPALPPPHEPPRQAKPATPLEGPVPYVPVPRAVVREVAVSQPANPVRPSVPAVARPVAPPPVTFAPSHRPARMPAAGGRLAIGVVIGLAACVPLACAAFVAGRVTAPKPAPTEQQATPASVPEEYKLVEVLRSLERGAADNEANPGADAATAAKVLEALHAFHFSNLENAFLRQLRKSERDREAAETEISKLKGEIAKVKDVRQGQAAEVGRFNAQVQLARQLLRIQMKLIQVASASISADPSKEARAWQERERRLAKLTEQLLSPNANWASFSQDLSGLDTDVQKLQGIASPAAVTAEVPDLPDVKVVQDAWKSFGTWQALWKANQNAAAVKVAAENATEALKKADQALQDWINLRRGMSATIRKKSSAYDLLFGTGVWQ